MMYSKVIHHLLVCESCRVPRLSCSYLCIICLVQHCLGWCDYSIPNTVLFQSDCLDKTKDKAHRFEWKTVVATPNSVYYRWCTKQLNRIESNRITMKLHHKRIESIFNRTEFRKQHICIGLNSMNVGNWIWRIINCSRCTLYFVVAMLYVFKIMHDISIGTYLYTTDASNGRIYTSYYQQKTMPYQICKFIMKPAGNRKYAFVIIE